MTRLLSRSLPLVITLGIAFQALAALITTPTTPTPLTIVEFYNAKLDHYFITGNAAEITALDSGTLGGWLRTGNEFSAYTPTAAAADLNPVCRFYGMPEAGLDSHFYTASAQECVDVRLNFASSWQLESGNVFKVQTPSPQSGACPSSTAPVYRLFNGRTDVNHRYTTDTNVRAAMIAAGFVPEGAGSDGVVFCVASSTADASGGSVTQTSGGSTSSSAGSNVSIPKSAVINTTATGPDEFTFTGNAAGFGSAALTYRWSFGDGGTATGSPVSHQYSDSRSYNVTVVVTDPHGTVASASTSVAPVHNAPPPSNGTGHSGTTSLSASIVITPITLDTFSFGSSAIASTNAAIVSYAWNLGDGSTASGPTVTHTYSAAGTYVITLNVADSSGARTTATQTVVAAVQTATPPPTSTPSSGSSDFDARRTGPGVVRSFDFDTMAQLGGGYTANFGTYPGTTAKPTIDTTVKASGTGSLRFDVTSQSGPNGAGSWWGNFSSDLQTQFGENSEFYVQWRQRFSPTMLTTVFQDSMGSAQGGIKQAIITTGDQVDPNQAYGVKVYDSCESIGTVITTHYQHRMPIVYNSCTGSTIPRQPPYAGLYEPVAGQVGNVKFQNAVSNCTYYDVGTNNGDVTIPPGCFGWAADEWMTFEMRIKTGPRNNEVWDSSEVQLWGARDGKAPVLILDWKPGTNGYFPLIAGLAAQNQRFGKIWLLPYMTDKGAQQAHPLAQVWYDELIISRQAVKFPGGFSLPSSSGGTTSTPSTTPPPTSTPTPPTAGGTATTAQIAALPTNGLLNLGPYRCTDPIGAPVGYCGLVTDYSGLAYDPVRRQMAIFGGGHVATNYDAVNTFSMSSLGWTEQYLPTPIANMTRANYDRARGAWLAGPSGPYPRPASRHTVDQNVIVGDELIVLATVEGNATGIPAEWGTDGSYEFVTRGKIAHFNFVTKKWTYTNADSVQQWPGAAYDAKSGKIVMLGQQGLVLYDPVAKTNPVLAIDFGTYAGIAQLRDEQGVQLANVVNYNNNLVYFPPNDRFYYFDRFTGRVFELNLNRTDFSKSTVTLLATTGNGPTTEVGFDFDSKNNLIGGGPVNNVFYAFNPVTKTWATKTLSGNVGSVAFHALAYDPSSNVYVFLTPNGSTGRTTWAYRWN